VISCMCSFALGFLSKLCLLIGLFSWFGGISFEFFLSVSSLNKHYTIVIVNYKSCPADKT
jgi:hypothetical protein